MRESIWFQNSRGQKLEGDLHLPEGKGPFPVIIMNNGLAGRGKEAEERIGHADYFAQNGFLTARYNFCGHGKSQGKFTEFTVGQAIDDCQSVINLVSNHHLADADRINIWGASLGSLVACYIVAETKQVKSLVLVSTAPSLFPPAREKQLQKIINLWRKQGWIVLPGYEKKMNFSFYQDARKRNAFNIIEKINCPVLLIHGKNDLVEAPLEQAKDFYQVLREPKQMIVLPQGGHKYNKIDNLKIREASYQWFADYGA